MMCKEMKEDLKRMRSLRYGGRKDGENNKDVLDFVNNEIDYEGLFLLKGEWFIVRNG